MAVIPRRGPIRPLGQERIDTRGISAAAEGFAAFGDSIQKTFGGLLDLTADAIARNNINDSEREFRTQAQDIVNEELLSDDVGTDTFRQRVDEKISEALDQKMSAFALTNPGVRADAFGLLSRIATVAGADAAQKAFVMNVQKIETSLNTRIQETVESSNSLAVPALDSIKKQIQQAGNEKLQHPIFKLKESDIVKNVDANVKAAAKNAIFAEIEKDSESAAESLGDGDIVKVLRDMGLSEREILLEQRRAVTIAMATVENGVKTGLTTLAAAEAQPDTRIIAGRGQGDTQLGDALKKRKEISAQRMDLLKNALVRLSRLAKATGSQDSRQRISDLSERVINNVAISDADNLKKVTDFEAVAYATFNGILLSESNPDHVAMMGQGSALFEQHARFAISAEGSDPDEIAASFTGAYPGFLPQEAADFVDQLFTDTKNPKSFQVAAKIVEITRENPRFRAKLSDLAKLKAVVFQQVLATQSPEEAVKIVELTTGKTDNSLVVEYRNFIKENESAKESLSTVTGRRALLAAHSNQLRRDDPDAAPPLMVENFITSLEGIYATLPAGEEGELLNPKDRWEATLEEAARRTLSQWGVNNVGGSGPVWMQRAFVKEFGQDGLSIDDNEEWINDQLRTDLFRSAHPVPGIDLNKVPLQFFSPPEKDAFGKPFYFVSYIGKDGFAKMFFDKDTNQPIMVQPDYETSGRAIGFEIIGEIQAAKNEEELEATIQKAVERREGEVKREISPFESSRIRREILTKKRKQIRQDRIQEAKRRALENFTRQPIMFDELGNPTTDPLTLF